MWLPVFFAFHRELAIFAVFLHAFLCSTVMCLFLSMFNLSFFRPTVLRFRKLTHKGYAAFVSMHREVTIGRLSRVLCDMEMLKAGRTVALCSAFAASTVVGWAAVPPDRDSFEDALTLEEVQVTALAQLSSTAQPVTVINHEQLRSLPVHSVADVLQQLPGLDIRQRGPTDVQADVSLRGCTADQTLIFLNGQNLTDPQTGHYSMDLPLTGDEIERVEVYASAASGLGAYAGVINIVTRQPSEDEEHSLNRTAVDLSLKAGEYGLFNPTVVVSHRRDKLHSVTSVGYNQSIGFISNTDYRIASAFTHLIYKNVQWQAGTQFKNAGANAFYALAYPEQFDATRMAFTSVAYQHPFSRHWRVSVDATYRVHFDRFELFREGTETPAWYTNHNRHTTHSGHLNAQIAYRWSWGTTMLGVNAQDNYIKSNTLGEHNRFTFNYVAKQSLHGHGVSATLIAGGTYNTAFGSDWAVSLDVNYRPTSRWMLYANTARALRLPNYSDLYYHSKTQISNPNLKPEHAVKAEIGAGYNHPSWSVALAVFYRYGSNIIDWIQHPQQQNELWYCEQLMDLHTVGSNLSAAYRPTQPAGGFLKQIRVTYSYLYSDKPKGDYLSKYALDYLKHNASLTLDHVVWSGIGACWQFAVQDRHGSFLNRKGSIEPYKTVYLLSGKVYYDYAWTSSDARSAVASTRSLHVALECTNMLNRSYYDIGGILQPPHWVKALVLVRL